jgi:hypothetical protein
VNTARGGSFYQDVELFTYAAEENDGAIMVRHRYNYGDTPPAS